MKGDAALYRARIAAMQYFIAKWNNDPVLDAGKNSPRELLKNGYIHEKVREQVEAKAESLIPEMPGDPLSFTELTSYSTWFSMHPEKVAGKEIVTTSFHFPLEIEGKKEDVIRTIQAGLHKQQPSTTTNAMRLRLKLKAKAAKVKMKMQGLDGCNCTLGSLPAGMDTFIDEHADALREVLYKSQKLSGLSGLGDAGTPKMLTFSDVVEKYNKGISEDEIKAWVWYKRNQGEPMKGWNKYYDVKDKEIDKWVKKGVLFYHDKNFLPYPVYAYGNMYDRTLQLEKDREYIVEKFGLEVLERHTLVIQEAKPRQLSVLDPDKRNRPKILAISKFAKEFTVEELREEFAITGDGKTHSLVEWFKHFLKWLTANDESAFVEVTEGEIWNYYIQANNLGRSLSETQKEVISKYAPLEGEELFGRFLHEALKIEDQQRLDMQWNRIYNGWSSVPYHRIPVGFQCSPTFKNAPLEISQIQREGIAFMKAVGSGIVAYDVGVGKTMTAIVTMANELYSGKCKRPVIVCPNAVYEKWKREIFGYTDEKTNEFVSGVLSGTGIELNDWYNLGTSVIKGIDLENPVQPGSITMLTYEGFAKLGFGKKVMTGLFEELKVMLAQAEDDSGKSKRDVEKQYQAFRQLIGVGNKGTICDIDTVGFDYIVIDEAHNFKNVFSYVPTDEGGVKRFKIQTADSARGKKAFFICNYIQRTYGSNVMLLTATPFTNNPIEVFSMLSLVGYASMKNMGVYNLFSFMETFILQSLEYVNSYDGSIEQKHVVKAFNNRLILQKLIYNHINYKTGEEAGVKRPCKINLPKTTTTNDKGQVVRLPKDQQLATYLKMTDKQEVYQTMLISLAQSGHTPYARMKNVMRALAGSLDNALSPFIYEKSTPESYKVFVDGSPKIKYVMDCIASVKQYHEKNLNEPVSGQVIYMNRGKEYFKYIKEYLEKELGYQTNIKFNNSTVDEVEFITSEVSQDDREFIKDAFLEGVCKVIIGTASIREGIDLQRQGSVLYNCYPDWNPTDVKQLEGRIWRQGNMFGYVRVVMPLVQDSMDVFVFQKLEEKTSRVNDIWYRADRGNVLDVDALDPEEVKFALYTDLKELSKIVIDKELREVYRKIALVDENIEAIKELSYAIQQTENYRKRLQSMLSSARTSLPDIETSIQDEPYRWEGLSDTQLQEYKERAAEIIREIENYEASAPQEDKELLRICNRLRHSIYRTKGVISFDEYGYEKFKVYFSTVEKAKRTIMEPKGYSLDSDFTKILEDLEQEGKDLSLHLKTIMSNEHLEAVIDEIAQKKAMNKVDGLPPEQAVEDFKSLNHLLAFKFSQSDTDTCIIPDKNSKPTTPAPSDKSKVLRLRLALKAKAAKVKLKLAA